MTVVFKESKNTVTYETNKITINISETYRGKEGSEECQESILNDGTYPFIYKKRERLVNGVLCSEENNDIRSTNYVAGGKNKNICNSTFVPNFDYMLVNFEYNTDDGVTMGVPKYNNKLDLDPALIFDNPINSFLLKGNSELNNFLSTDNRRDKAINILVDGSIGCGQENNSSLPRVDTNRIGNPYPDNFVYPDINNLIEEGTSLIQYNIVYIQSMGDDVTRYPQSENFIINFKLILERLNFIKEKYKIEKSNDKIRIELLAGWCSNQSIDNRFIMNIKAYKGGTFKKHPSYGAVLENHGGIERPIDKWISEAPKDGCCGNTENKRKIATIEYNIITKSARIIKY